MKVQSFRRVWNFERRLYSIERWRIPAPNGIPLRGFAYFLAAILVSLIVWSTPGVGFLYGVLPWPVRHLGIPFLVAYVGMEFSPDGLRADVWLLGWIQFEARRVRRLLARPDRSLGAKLRVRWDSSDVVLHRARVHGPATAAFSVPVTIDDRWEGLRAQGSSFGSPHVREIRADDVLHIRSAHRRG